jgi:hypothetical protein
MKIKFGLLIALFVAGVGCKQVIEQKKEDALATAMTANTWYVGQYLEGANIITPQFDGYEFNFKANNTVIAKKGLQETTGQWTADVNTKLLTSTFSTQNILNRLNGVWYIYYQDAQGPKMSQTLNGIELKLALKIK